LFIIIDDDDADDDVLFRKLGAPSGVDPKFEEKSVAEDWRRDLPVVRLNIWGTRAREREEGTLPSGGWSC
jgi:hypothetical protein